MKRTLLNALIPIVLIAIGCQATPTEKPGTVQSAGAKPGGGVIEGYRVMSHDVATGEWVILRNGTFDGTYLVKRITAVCDSYRWGTHERVLDPAACDLRVGEMMVPNPFPKDGTEFLDIFELGSESLYIIRGRGSDRVTQGFRILKYEIVQ